ncbi:hypothetical protein ACRALDRAFT_1093052 [Sodiomyces alcalophilus JCM 7366]|uniref:uncharacterized protein n=1 Tax=Sodiomyces alcalophilus JCM 7366 TaxID=591952 RepID=UPI0039B42A4B
MTTPVSQGNMHEAWDLDSDEIRSTASDELHATRPNRWRGAASTWRQWTEEERLLYQSLEQARDRDLAIHLYNAFALKNRHRRDQSAPLGDDLLDFGDWKPPQSWSAWPLPAHRVPSETLLRETHDEYDGFTLRRKDGPTDAMPGRVLEEEVTAAVLKIAKERFRERERDGELGPDEGHQDGLQMGTHSDVSDGESVADSPSGSVQAEDDMPELKQEPASEAGEMDLDEQEEEGDEMARESPGPPPRRKEYVPVVSADDDLSHVLLRPAVRHILSQLDGTLRTLHNVRMAGLSTLDRHDDSDSDRSAVVSGMETDASRRRSKSRNQKRKRQAKGAAATWNDRTKAKGKMRAYDGPSSVSGDNSNDDDSDNYGDHSADDESASDTSAGHSRQGNDRRRPQTPTFQNTSPNDAQSRMFWREGRLRRWALLDWRDVLGAAALSGFDGDVAARAAQRCADLFGQSMEFRTLEEKATKTARQPQHYVTTRVCRPGEPLPPLSGEESGDAEEVHLEETRRRLREVVAKRHDRRVARREAVAGHGDLPLRFNSSDEERGREEEEEEEEDTNDEFVFDGSDGRRAGRQGTPSRTTGIKPNRDDHVPDGNKDDDPSSIDITQVEAALDGFFYCPVPYCRRHKKGFPARRGLREHFKLTHGQPTSETGTFYCPVGTCRYHLLSFKTKKNLKAHLRKMHTVEEVEAAEGQGGRETGGQGEGVEGGDEKEGRITSVMEALVKSEDEMEGGVHVDGFLRPIKIRCRRYAVGFFERGAYENPGPDGCFSRWHGKSHPPYLPSRVDGRGEPGRSYWGRSCWEGAAGKELLGKELLSRAGDSLERGQRWTTYSSALVSSTLTSPNMHHPHEMSNTYPLKQAKDAFIFVFHPPETTSETKANVPGFRNHQSNLTYAIFNRSTNEVNPLSVPPPSADSNNAMLLSLP